MSVELIPVAGLPEIRYGDRLGERIGRLCVERSYSLNHGDVLVIAQKVVSKAEGRVVNLSDVQPSAKAVHLSVELEKDARLVELILRESRRIVKMGRGTIIVETHHGFVCANAGIDLSNIGPGKAVLLPQDPDTSARSIREDLRRVTGTAPSVIITDTFGRPWRLGTTDVAIGVAGLNPLTDYRGTCDKYGYELKASVTAIADEIAAAAELIMGKSRGVPVVLVRGCDFEAAPGSARLLIRPASEDLFRDP